MQCRTFIVLLIGATSFAEPVNADDFGGDSPMDFARAEEFSFENLAGKILNGRPSPYWIGDEDRFWLSVQNSSGHRYIIVDAATGEQKPAFDHEAVALSLKSTGIVDVDADSLPIVDLKFSEHDLHIKFDMSDYRCGIDGSDCRPTGSVPVSNGILSSDGRHIAFIRDHNVWLRNVESGSERALTDNGVENYSYGYSDSFRYTPGGVVSRGRANLPWPIGGLIWSPDGDYVVNLRVDRRSLPLRLAALEHLPPDGKSPIVHMDRRVVVKDSIDVIRTMDIINVTTGAVITADIPVENLQGRTTDHFSPNNVYWDLKRRTLFFQTGDRSNRRRMLYSVNMQTGSSRIVVDESEEFNYHLNLQNGNRPNVFVGSNGHEVVWYSQRTGFGHLYLYDARTGKLKSSITQGDWVVFDLLHVDESRRVAYFTAGGREPGRNPYFAHLYRASLDGGEPLLLTPEDADHEFPNRLPVSDPRQRRISPSGRYFIDIHSTVEQPPRMLVRRTADGARVADILEADVSALYATGWRPPQTFAVTAADGQTKLYGVMYKPLNMQPDRQYAVVNQVYPAPEGSASPTTFMDTIDGKSGLLGKGMQQIAELGFIGVTLDARGSGKRNKSFSRAFLGTEDVTGVADHKAAIEALAKQHDFMDLQRVGVIGRSYGGYGALRAALLYPEFFDVCISVAGPHDFRELIRYMRTWLGVPDDPPAKQHYYDLYSNLRLASRLEGKLLLIYGEIDENVPLVHAIEIFDALIKADKKFDTLIVPNSGHDPAASGYGRRRILEYLVENLGGPRPVH